MRPRARRSFQHHGQCLAHGDDLGFVRPERFRPLRFPGARSDRQSSSAKVGGFVYTSRRRCRSSPQKQPHQPTVRPKALSFMTITLKRMLRPWRRFEP
ncbi:hypothetical protein ACFX2H_022212 [Malus domestica]